jgi:hypothetical protein
VIVALRMTTRLGGLLMRSEGREEDFLRSAPPVARATYLCTTRSGDFSRQWCAVCQRLAFPCTAFLVALLNSHSMNSRWTFRQTAPQNTTMRLMLQRNGSRVPEYHEPEFLRNLGSLVS